MKKEKGFAEACVEWQKLLMEVEIPQTIQEDPLAEVRDMEDQGQTDNSWGPQAIGDHGAPVSWPTLKPHPKKPMKGTRDISWGPLLTPGPRAVPEFPN
ncbi:unnamed protein product, partial [Staurois parvus]